MSLFIREGGDWGFVVFENLKFVGKWWENLSPNKWMGNKI